MNVIWHDDIFAARNSFVALLHQVINEMFMKCIIGQNRFSVICAEGDEIQWGVKALKYML